MFGKRNDARRRRNSKRPRAAVDDSVIRAIEESLARRADPDARDDEAPPHTVVVEGPDGSESTAGDADSSIEFAEMDESGEAGGPSGAPKTSATNETHRGAVAGSDASPQTGDHETNGTGVSTSPANGQDKQGTRSEYIDNKVRQVVDSLQGLEHLSELVSLRYNPFLEMEENDVFDGKRHKPDELVRGFFSPTGEPETAVVHSEPEPPAFMEVAKLTNKQEREEIDEEIDLSDLPIDEIHSAIGRPLKAPEPEPEPTPDAPGGAKPIGHGAPLNDRDRARRTLLVLSWFRQLQMHGPPACLYLFIDHCYRMEWIDESCYKWLVALAGGVAQPDPELSFADLELSTLELTDIHEANLLFLDDLFSDRLRFGERGYLNTQIGDYFEGA